MVPEQFLKRLLKSEPRNELTNKRKAIKSRTALRIQVNERTRATRTLVNGLGYRAHLVPVVAVA